MRQRRLLAWTATAVALALLVSASGVESKRRSKKEQPSLEQSSKNDISDLQTGVEELLENGSKLRWQIVDMLGKIVYDRYDEMNLSQLEVLYQIYHETLRRKFNIFEIASSLASKSGGLNAKDVCEAVNNNVCTSKERSKICARLPLSDSRRSTNTTQDIPEVVKKQFPRGVTIPAILKEIRDKKIKITPKLLAGLIANIQYDSFDNEVLRAENTLVDYLNTLPNSTVFSPGSKLHTFVSLDLLLKALLEHNNNQFPGPAKRAALILIDHFERDLNSINNNIEHFGIIYENSTINLKYLFDLVIPEDLVDTDIIEARDNLEKAIKKDDFVKNNLSIDKYRHASPDQLMLEILRQMNHVGQKVDVPKNILKALRMHADFWRKERTIDDVSDFLMLFNAYDNLRDKPEYKQFFQYVNLIKEKLKHSENVNLELTCSMPRPCLRRVLLKILECSMVDDETKKIVSRLIRLLNSRGTPIVIDRKVPPQLEQVPEEKNPDGSRESQGSSGESEPVLKPEFVVSSENPLKPKPGSLDSEIPEKPGKPMPPSIGVGTGSSEKDQEPLPGLIPDDPDSPSSEVPSDSQEVVPKPLPGKCNGAKNCDETTATTNLPLEESTLPSQVTDSSVEGSTTENSLPEITKSSSESLGETSTIIPSKTTTFLPLKENTKRKMSTEEVLSTTPTIPKPIDHESTTPVSVTEDTTNIENTNIPPGSETEKDDDPNRKFKECFDKCIKGSNGENCEESCEMSTEKSCQGPNCPDAPRSTECETGSGEDCSTESSSTNETPSQPTSTSNTESSLEDCNDSNPENCKKKPLEKCEGPNCSTTVDTCEGGNCTEENKVPTTTESYEGNGKGDGVVCDGSTCKPKEDSQATHPSHSQESEEGTKPEEDVSTEHPSEVDEDEGKLCDTKDPHRQRKSERLKKMRRLNVIDAEEQALNLYDEGDGSENVNLNKNQEDKLGPLLQGLTKTEEDTAKHKMHQTELRRSLSNSKEEKPKSKEALKKHLRRSLDSEESKINNQKDNSKIENRRSDNSKIANRRSDNSKIANRRTDNSKIPSRRSENSKIPNRRNDNSKIPNRRNDNSKIPNRRTDNSKIPNRRTDNSKVPTRRSENSKIPNRRNDNSKIPNRRNDNSKIPNRRNDNSKIPNRRNDNSKIPTRRSDDSKIPNRRNEDSKIPNRRSEDSTIPNRRSEDTKIPNRRNENSKVPNRRSENSKIPNRRSEDSKIPNRRNEDSKIPNRRSEDSKIPNRRREDLKTPNRRTNLITDNKESFKNDQE